ncbi:MAG: DUF1343 domain-containing protein [Sulfurovum sp.]|nr:MAG: DUF1343 domain-containing protein [Sulfurovum sp.]
MKKVILFILLSTATIYANIITGAEDMKRYLPMLQGKNVALVVNQSSLVWGEHLVDRLLKENIHVKKIFAPEHGFRGDADAGEHLKNGRDKTTGIPIISLYGKHKAPSKRDLRGIDVIVFDIQDVGVRFYTYISTLHYVMEAAAKYKIPLIVLDRPNPNGARVDGEILNYKYQSFVGMHPVPILYGMTIGEYAMMINAEGWLKENLVCDLRVIRLQNYRHDMPYALPVKPSPNLPNELSVFLYPSLGFFEGTTFSVGRGTHKQFQLYGNPHYRKRQFSFRPIPLSGAKHPKHKNRTCYGVDLSHRYINLNAGINLSYLIDAYQNYPKSKRFFLKNRFFDKLAGSDRLRKQIKAGISAKDIKRSWRRGLDNFKKIRVKYLLYP